MVPVAQTTDNQTLEEEDVPEKITVKKKDIEIETGEADGAKPDPFDDQAANPDDVDAEVAEIHKLQDQDLIPLESHRVTNLKVMMKRPVLAAPLVSTIKMLSLAWSSRQASSSPNQESR